MNLTLLKGYPDFIGKRAVFSGYGSGPVSYVRGGDPIVLPLLNYYIDAAAGGFSSVSGNYFVLSIPAGTGTRAVWKAKWFYAAGQVGVDGFVLATVGSGQTPGTYLVAGAGGTGATGFGGASIQIIVGAGGTVTSATLASSGQGYFTAPTFTLVTGGTPGTITTVTVGSSQCSEVGAATNLSAEQVQLGGFCGQY